MNPLRYPIVKITIFFILGIFIAHFFKIESIWLWILNFGCIILLLATYLFGKFNNRRIGQLFDYVVPLQFVILGILVFHLQSSKNKRDFIGNQGIDLSTPKVIQFEIHERLKPTSFYERYVVEINHINQHNVTGKAILRIPKSDTLQGLPISATIITTDVLKEVPTSLNPGSFNYKLYLENKEIFYQLTVPIEQISITKINKNSLRYLADKLRTHINSSLKSEGFKQEHLAIFNALLLGQRTDISPEMTQNYAAAGAIHLLAISGLHIGILYLFLSFILKPFNRLGKNGKIYKLFLILIFLWCFAILSGLSPSILRAVTMFTIISISDSLKRKNHLLNALAISALILLVFNTKLVLDVGFQLSYLAVIGIVCIQPTLFNWLKTKNRILNYFIGLITVSVAAQISVFPLSLFYFHQFPALFFISNLVLIPLVTLILILGLLVIGLSLCHFLPSIITKYYGSLIDFMNSVVAYIAQKEQFVISGISFNSINLVASLLLVLSIIYLINRKSVSSVFLVLVGIILVQVSVLYNKLAFTHNEIVIFQENGKTLLGKKSGGAFCVYSDSLNSFEYNLVKSYNISNFSKLQSIEHSQNIYEVNDKRLLRIDTSNVYVPIKNLEAVLLTHSPKINLERMIDSIQPKKIIADGSNYYSIIKMWEQTCQKRKLPFHATHKTGAYILK